MIDDALQEQASLHALGMLRGEELRAFERQCAASPELQALVNSLREMADGLAHALPPVSPPASLRESILRGAAGSPPAGQTPAKSIVPFPVPAKPRSEWKRAAAALAVLAPAALAIHFAIKAGDEKSSRETSEKNAATLVTERDALTKETQELTQARDTAGSRYTSAQKKIEELSALYTKQTAELVDLGKLKTQLDAEVTALKARKLSDEAQIALLSPTPKSPSKAVAVSLWNQKEQDGVFMVQNLPKLKPGRNYQLWVIDGEKPVSAGLLTVDGNGGGRIEFKARKQIAKPAAFAVTNEPAGEQETPTMDNMVLVGK